MLDDFEIKESDLKETLNVVRNNRKRKKMIDKNLKILKKHFSHDILAMNLRQVIGS